MTSDSQLQCSRPPPSRRRSVSGETQTQQSTYLPEFVGEDVPAAALAVMEPRPLFDPFKLDTKATKNADGGYTLTGVKSLVPRAAEAELFVIAADLDGKPAMFIVESKTRWRRRECRAGDGNSRGSHRDADARRRQAAGRRIARRQRRQRTTQR